jgi:arylformamidase
MIDISVELRVGTPEWPGDTPFSCGWTWAIAAGASVNVSTLTTSPHVGTHADAPLHVRDGWAPSDALPLDAFIGRAAVVDVSSADPDIDLAALERHARASGVDLAGTERLLLRTGRTIADGAFPADWPALTPACAAALAARGLRLLGVDAPSVDGRESKDLAVHHALFAGGAFNIENLDLRHAPPGVYELVAPPVKLVGLDAAPLRAVLRPLI